MILKIFIVLILLFLVYLLFFKRNREREILSKKEEIEDILVSCPTCKTYVSKKEAILSDGKYYCSKDCFFNK